MASLIDIFNLTLVQLAEETSLDPAQGGIQADLTRVWPMCRDEVLAAHPWNCSLVRTTLAADAAAPAYGFSYRYTLPADPYCLKVWRVGLDDERPRVKWVVVGRKIETNRSAPLPVLLGARVEDTQLYSPGLVSTCAARLAAAVAYKLTDSRTKEEMMMAFYRDTLRAQRSVDGQEGVLDYDDGSLIEEARDA